MDNPRPIRSCSAARPRLPASYAPKRDEMIAKISAHFGYSSIMLSGKSNKALRALWQRIDTPEVQGHISTIESGLEADRAEQEATKPRLSWRIGRGGRGYWSI